jgi:hypothetical protein
MNHLKSKKLSPVPSTYLVSLETLGYYSEAAGSQSYPLALMKLFYPTKGNFLALVSKFGSVGLCRRLKKRMTAVSPLPIRILDYNHMTQVVQGIYAFVHAEK